MDTAATTPPLQSPRASTRRTLLCVRPSLFSRTRVISDGGTVVATLHPRYFGWSSEALIDGVDYGLRSSGFWSTNYTLETGGHEVARVTKCADATDRYEFVSDGHRSLAVEPKGFFAPRYRLFDGEQEVGSVETESLFKCTLLADLPGEVPLPLTVLVLFVCIEIRRSQHNSGS